jgi:hypothetical protein
MKRVHRKFKIAQQVKCNVPMLQKKPNVVYLVKDAFQMLVVDVLI